MSLRLLVLCAMLSTAFCQEPFCSSFVLLEKLLEKLVRMESRIEIMETQLEEQETGGRLGDYQQGAHSNLRSVAFFATASDRQSGLSDQQVIKFNKVITNVGQGYDHSSGIFTAPTDGTYNFQTTVLTDNNAEIWGFIDVNGNSNAWYNAHATNGRHASGSQNLVVALKQGDQVSVRNHGSGGMLYGGHYTTFSGYLLF